VTAIGVSTEWDAGGIEGTSDSKGAWCYCDDIPAEEQSEPTNSSNGGLFD